VNLLLAIATGSGEEAESQGRRSRVVDVLLFFSSGIIPF
jgi:hypothetical protein